MGMQKVNIICAGVFLLVCCLSWRVMASDESDSNYAKKFIPTSSPIKRQASVEHFLSDSERDHQLPYPDNTVKYTQISYGTTGSPTVSPYHTKSSQSSTLENKQDEKLIKRFEKIRDAIRDIIEFLRTDGHPGTKPSVGISWFALGTAFVILSPMLIPILMSPFVLVIGFLVFLPTIIEFYRNGEQQ